MVEIGKIVCVSLVLSAASLCQSQAALATQVEPSTGASPVSSSRVLLEDGTQHAAYRRFGLVAYERSLSNGDSFSLLHTWSSSPTSPVLVADGDDVCIGWVDGAAVMVVASVDRGQTFSAPVNVDAQIGSNSNLAMALDGGMVRALWQNTISSTRTIEAYEASVSSPLSVGSTTIGAPTLGVQDLLIASDGLRAYAGWRESNAAWATVKNHGLLTWPSVTQISSVSTLSDLSLTASNGTGVYSWIGVDAIPGGGTGPQVQASAWTGSAFSGPAVLMTATSMPSNPYGFTDLVSCSGPSKFYVACVRDQDSSVTINEQRVAVTSSATGTGAWGPLLDVDSDPVGVTNYYAENPAMACNPLAPNEVAVSWSRTTQAGVSSLRFSKSVDGGVTWSGVPVNLRDNFNGSPMVDMDASNVVVAYYAGTVGGVGLQAQLVCGYMQYELSVATPCQGVSTGGSAGTTIAGVGIPWSYEPGSGSNSVQIIATDPNPLSLFPFVIATTINRPANGACVLDFILHVDSGALVTAGNILPLSIPDSVVQLGTKLVAQGVWLDSGLMSTGWTNGLEVRVN